MDELKELKSVLRALAVSSRYKVDLITLQRDYRNMIGSYIPVQKWGYRTVLPFLRDCCSDSFLIHGSSRNPELTVIVPECMKHLFVQKRAVPTGIEMKEESNATESLNHDNCVEPGDRQPAELTEVAAPEPSDSELDTTSRSILCERLRQLAGELQELLRAHERGVPLTDLKLLYRRYFDREPSTLPCGFYSLPHLLQFVDEQVIISTEPDGELYLRVLSAPPSPRQSPRPPMTPPQTPSPPPHRDEPLPGIPPAPQLFPLDCIKLLEAIPRQQLSGVYPGAMLAVEVGEVYSPSHFWLRRLGADHPDALDTLMDDMEQYYNRGEGKSRVLERAATLVGQYCAALYEGLWHRALVVKVLSTKEVKVRYVDYGTVSRVSAHALKPLLRRYVGLAAQAVRARLARVRPAAAARRWDHSAAQHFLSLVEGRHLYANVVAADQEEVVLETLLIDASGEVDVCLSTELVRAGYADRRAGSAQGSGESYLLPRWEPLEAGDTLSFEEIHRYLAAGIELDSVQAYSRHVASALPPPELAPPELSPLQRELPPRQPELPPRQPGLAPCQPQLPPRQPGLAPRQLDPLAHSAARSPAAPYIPRATYVPRAPPPSVAASAPPTADALLSLPMECQTAAVPEPCVMCTWAASFLDPSFKGTYDLLCARSPVSDGRGTHRFITNLIQFGVLRPALPPAPPGLAAPPAPAGYHVLSGCGCCLCTSHAPRGSDHY